MTIRGQAGVKNRWEADSLGAVRGGNPAWGACTIAGALLGLTCCRGMGLAKRREANGQANGQDQGVSQAGKGAEMARYDVSRHGAEGGRAKGRNAPLGLTRIEKELPELVDPASAKRSLSIIRGWLAAGMLPTGTGGPLVALHREWLTAHQAELDADRVKQLEQQLATLREQLARAGGGHLRKAG